MIPIQSGGGAVGGKPGRGGEKEGSKRSGKRKNWRRVPDYNKLKNTYRGN